MQIQKEKGSFIYYRLKTPTNYQRPMCFLQRELLKISLNLPNVLQVFRHALIFPFYLGGVLAFSYFEEQRLC